MLRDLLEPLLTAEEAKRADQHTMRSLGISGVELMERAGRSVAQHIEGVLRTSASQSDFPVVVICGPGNNGGDGWVVARRLWQNGFRTAVLSTVDAGKLRGEAQVAAQHFFAASQNELWSLPNLDPCAQVLHSQKQLLNLLDLLRPIVIVDALFGTGLKKPAEGLHAEVIASINSYRAKQGRRVQVISVDLPSGLPSDGQAWPHEHILSDRTVAIQYRKITHLSGVHLRACGDVVCVDIGIAFSRRPEVYALLSKNQPPLSLLKPIDRSAYKGHFGHVGVLLGSYGMQGASELCAYAALRSGAGLASILQPGGATMQLQNNPEIMRRIIDGPPFFNGGTSLVVGPGLGPDRETLAEQILQSALAPVIVDAGALATWMALGKKGPKAVIATPHPGEAARLLKSTAAEVEQDRIRSIRSLLKLSAHGDVTWILKGTCPIVARAPSEIIVLEGGVPTLSIGGSGDVLAGLCAALIGQTATPFDAALLGVATHLQAGRNLLSRQKRGFLAHEIADELPRILFGN